MKFLATNPSFCQTTDEPKKAIAARGHELVWIPGATKEQMIAENPDVLINGVEPIDEEIIDKCTNLKVISHHGVGTDNVAVDYARAKGIAVRVAAGSNSEAVADHSFALAMSCARRLNEVQAICKSGVWKKPVGYGVWGKTMGIIGLGGIGKGVAKRARGFNMDVMAYDIFWDEKFAEEWGIKKASVEEIVAECDYISLHCNLTEATTGLISYPQLQKMKPTAILVNCGRGPLINHDDLVRALNEGLIAGAGIDVFDVEPVPLDDPLFSFPNVVCTPHSAAYTVESLANMSNFAVNHAFEELDKLGL